MTGAVTRGLTIRDFEDMNIGQIVDFCKTYNEMNKSEDDKKTESKTRTAGQGDFDRF